MEECKHEIKYLVGVAGGIICTRCGKKFDAMPEPAPEPEKKAVKKRVRKVVN